MIRYATCIKCAHIMSMLEHDQLRFDVGCPRCLEPKAFGPGVFVKEFNGYTLQEANRQWHSKEFNRIPKASE